MKTWKKIVGITTITGIALGGLAYFAKKKSLEDDFDEDFSDAFEDFDEEFKQKADKTDVKKEKEDSADRNYVHITLDNTTAENTSDIKKTSSDTTSTTSVSDEKTNTSDKES